MSSSSPPAAAAAAEAAAAAAAAALEAAHSRLAEHLVALSEWQTAQGRERRPHVPRVLAQIAAVHAATPADALTGEGIQARAWELLCAAYRRGPDAAEALALTAFYTTVFDLDGEQVIRHLRAHAAPGSSGGERAGVPPVDPLAGLGAGGGR